MRTFRNYSVSVSDPHPPHAEMEEALCDFYFYPRAYYDRHYPDDFDQIELLGVRIRGVDCLQTLPEESLIKIENILYEELMYER